MIKEEIRYFFMALMFFTRIPCPKWVGYSDEALNKSSKYFPLVGWIVAAIASITFLIFSYILPLNISIILSMIMSVWVTGAFHEDGFTDVCDSFGGGWGKTQIMTIMKDSRIGAYGVIGICLLLLLKFFLLLEIAKISKVLVLISLLNAHSISRFVASTFAYTHQYVQDIDKSKTKPIATAKLAYSTLIYSSIFAILPIVLFKNWYFLSLIPIAYLSKMYLASYFKKHIGGYTGDCLGTSQQIAEVVVYMSILALWRFI